MMDAVRREPVMIHRQGPPMRLLIGSVEFLLEGVLFGSVTIRFENGCPTLAERHDNVKLSRGTASRP